MPDPHTGGFPLVTARPRLVRIAAIAALAVCPASIAVAHGGPAKSASAPDFTPIGTYSSGLGAGSAETAAIGGNRMYVTNADDNSLAIVNITRPERPQHITRIDLSPYGASPNSVDTNGQLVAVAMEAGKKTDNGSVVLLRTDGTHVATVRVGALPDMLAFSPRGNLIAVANEGEPNSYGQADSVDPEGSVSIIDVSRIKLSPSKGGKSKGKHGKGKPSPKPRVSVRTIGFREFNSGGARHSELPEGIRLNGPGASVAQDLEPEYVAWNSRGTELFVTLQENNAVARIDVNRSRVRSIDLLAAIDHNLAGSGLDASDRDGGINIQRWPVKGMPMPDALATFQHRGRTYYVTANEGDARDYTGFADEARVKSRTLDLSAFPNAAQLQKDESLGRLTISTTDGVNADGRHSELYSFGTRSATIWSDRGTLVWDSADQFEQMIARTNPRAFNANNTSNDVDDRSDNKGPEPEGVDVGRFNGRTYAFVGLERVGGFMVIDITTPSKAQVVRWVNNRDFRADAPVGPDSGPEIIKFVPPSKGRPAMVMVTNEISGTVTLYRMSRPRSTPTVLTLLHNNDGESSILPIPNPLPGGATIDTGGVAAYKSVIDREIADARAQGNAVVNVYAGDAFLASSTLACSLPPNPSSTPVYDAVAQRQMNYDAHVFGNHEFDFATPFLGRFINGFRRDGHPAQPFLSANLDVKRNADLAPLREPRGVIVGNVRNGKVIARSLVHIDPVTGDRIGVIGATTPLLHTISSPGTVRVTTSDVASTATVVQREINVLSRRYGIDKIVLVSHLQDVSNDRDLVSRLRGVDIAVAGGGDELLANPDTPLLPGEAASIVGTYPMMTPDAAGRQVPIVTTVGNYKYAGRLDVRFDRRGTVKTVLPTSGPRRVVPTVQTNRGAAAGIADAVVPNAMVNRTAVDPVKECIAGLEVPRIGTEVVLDTSREGNRAVETNAGNSITDGFLDSYDRYAPSKGLPSRSATPVIAIQNGGGIRQNAGDSLPATGAPGTLSRKNTLDVLAFLTNTVTVVREVSPADLKEIFERSVSSMPGQGGQFLQIAGLRVTVSLSGTAQVIQTDGSVTTQGTRVREVVLADGTPIVADGQVVPGAPKVSVVTNSFTADGGDNYPWLATYTDKVNLPATYEQAWFEYLASLPSTTVAGGSFPTISVSNPDYATARPGRRIIVQP